METLAGYKTIKYYNAAIAKYILKCTLGLQGKEFNSYVRTISFMTYHNWKFLEGKVFKNSLFPNIFGNCKFSNLKTLLIKAWNSGS